MRPYESQPPLSGSSNPQEYLREYGFVQKLTAKPWFLWTVAVLCIIASVMILIEPIRKQLGLNLTKVPDLLLPAALFTALFALYQWRTGKQETSMDSYYTRLDRANNWFKDSETVRQAMGFTSKAEAEITIYVCTEIDNLEYVVEKYRIGYIDAEQACRGLKTFQQRCIDSRDFRDIARRRVHEGDYTTTTTKVVCTICDAVDEMAERERATHRAMSGRNRPGATEPAPEIKVVLLNTNTAPAG